MSIVSRKNVNGIMDRIEVSRKESPISVFQHVSVNDEGENVPDFKMTFTSTVIGKEKLKRNLAGLVGVFDCTMGLEKMERFFENYEKQPVWKKVG